MLKHIIIIMVNYFYGGLHMSKYNEKSKEYTMKYVKENYDELKLRLPKGAKDGIKEHISQYKDNLPKSEQTMSGYIKASINEKMANDKAKYNKQSNL